MIQGSNSGAQKTSSRRPRVPSCCFPKSAVCITATPALPDPPRLTWFWSHREEHIHPRPASSARSSEHAGSSRCRSGALMNTSQSIRIASFPSDGIFSRDRSSVGTGSRSCPALRFAVYWEAAARSLIDVTAGGGAAVRSHENTCDGTNRFPSRSMKKTTELLHRRPAGYQPSAGNTVADSS